ncbi:MAG TPA: porin PorA family protein [Streptosporangiaceae bacterium]|jgi:hypothetical protein
MRRVVGLVLAGLGAFFLAVSLLMRLYVPGQVVKYPLDENTVITLVGHNMIYFSKHQGKQLSGVTLTSTSTIQGDVAAGKAAGSNTAVWTQRTALQNLAGKETLSYFSQRSAFNRRTGQLINCCGAAVGKSTTVQQSGQGFVWPFGTQEQTYQVFDPYTLRPEPFTFQGSGKVDGMKAFKFVEQVTNQKIGSMVVPKSITGDLSGGTVTLNQVMTATNTYWVDPVTGYPLNITENQIVALTDATGATKVIALQGTLAETPQSIRAAVDNANSAHTAIAWVQDIGPLIAAVLGIALLILGVLMVIQSPEIGSAAGYPGPTRGGSSGEWLFGDGSASGDPSANGAGGEEAARSEPESPAEQTKVEEAAGRQPEPGAPAEAGQEGQAGAHAGSGEEESAGSSA